MKNHWSIKLIAMLLVVVSAAVLAVGGTSVIFNMRYGFYGDRQDLQTKIQEFTDADINEYVYQAAMSAAVGYLRETNTLPGSIERQIWVEFYNYTWHDRNLWPEYEYTLQSTDGSVLASTYDKQTQYTQSYSATVYPENGIITNLGSARMEFPTYDELPADYSWESYHGEILPDLDERTIYYDLMEFTPNNVYRLERFNEMPMEVQIHLTESDIQQLTSQIYGINILKTTYQLRTVDIPLTVISLGVLILAVLYLSFAAGKTTTGEVRPRGTNRIPLDLFACLILIPWVLCLAGMMECFNAAYYTSDQSGVYWSLSCMAASGAGFGLSTTLMLCALCAQVRQGGYLWLKQTLILRCCRWCWSLCKRMGKWFLRLFSVEGVLGFISKAVMMVRNIIHTLPLAWQWGLSLCFLLLLALWATAVENGFGFILVLLVGTPLVLYGAHAFSKLRDAAHRMSQGDLDTKINVYNDFLFGNFAQFAEDLNALGDACVDAAMAKMKSERMKSELITNVSHDIKTPLTSIINYVDLLQRAESEEQRAEYLDVLDRQSQRLKKLIEDLMEMSKASSGNIAVELAENDIIEAVNQALGEFADRMDALRLSVVFRQREESIEAKFDGKLLWRVMSNVLSNVVKYALPGTRVYVDVAVTDTKVKLSIKNISREPLNITAEELMERFVRGDESRGSEGNGLGLNIAKSLMEVQGGDLELTVDGDLFKVTLTLN